jgi:hypothetical protein
MADEAIGAPAAAAPEPEAPIPFKQFLESVHPSVERNVSDLWETPRVFALAIGSKSPDPVLIIPNLRLHCQRCDGERTFRLEGKPSLSLNAETANAMLINYVCGDCRECAKSISLWITVGKAYGAGVAYKYGEKPPFGVPVPNKLLDLFGDDKHNFFKGRQCENQGLGVGAFAYYRRVVENHKNDLFDEIINVCKTLGAPEALIEELGRAKDEHQFSNAIKQIKTALPDGLLINGQNPLLALHRALSIGLHSESDAKCLETAHAARLVLTDLVEKMSFLRQDKRDLHNAVQLLIATRKDGA